MVNDFLQKAKDFLLGLNDNRDQEEIRPPREDLNEAKFGDVRPASEDPYGDPADQGNFGNVRPASEDPYGDPADQGNFGDVRPASEDPYGDPADEKN
jgi:hypothetical protein